MIKHRHQPVSRGVARIASQGSRYMFRTHTAGNNAIMTGCAGTQHLRMINRNQRRPTGITVTQLAQVSGIDAPRRRVPVWLALGMAYADEFVEGMILRKHPRVSLAGVKTARMSRHFDCSKAVRELGLPQSPVERAFKKAVMWFRQNGYA